MEIPKSTWTLKREYFKVKLIDNFKAEYLEWMAEIGHDCDDLDLLKFIDAVTSQDTVEFYQFPTSKPFDSDDTDQDYFEKIDDNHVLPRSVFELIT